MHSQVAKRLRSNSTLLNSVPPAATSTEYSHQLANLAAHILYRSPLLSQSGLPIYILNSWAFPDTKATDYNTLLPYVLKRLPDEEELIRGQGYEVVFFAGGRAGNEATQTKDGRPGLVWALQAYNVLPRAVRKKVQKLYIVHEKKWVRMLGEAFARIVSPKSKKKIEHVSTISDLARLIPIEDLLIPPAAYSSDRKKSPNIHAPYASGRRAFGVRDPLPTSLDGSLRLPRVLREATQFIIEDENVRTEGLFRVSARAQTVEILREAYDRGQKFIVWKDRWNALVYSHWKEGIGEVFVDDLEQTDGYELHAAAALIKLWYTKLQEPIFPRNSYQLLEKWFGTPMKRLGLEPLVEILSMNDEWSPIKNKTSRRILTMHLLPLLSKVAENSEFNQMTAKNLATCFAPSLLRGPDPLEDLKISAIICHILVAMIEQWKRLAPFFDTDFERYEKSLRQPEAVQDREDPLEEGDMKEVTELEKQTTGITLVDNDDGDAEINGSPPPLPPRPISSTIDGKPLGSNSSASSSTTSPAESPRNSGIAAQNESNSNICQNPLRRKPAPAIAQLPRYSTIMNDAPVPSDGTQYYNTVAPEEDGALWGDDVNDLKSRPPSYGQDRPKYEEEYQPHPSNLAEVSGPSSEASSVARKPLPLPKDET